MHYALTYINIGLPIFMSTTALRPSLIPLVTPDTHSPTTVIQHPLPQTLPDSNFHEHLPNDLKDTSDYSGDASDTDMDFISHDSMDMDNMADFPCAESPEFWMSIAVLSYCYTQP